MKKLLIVAILGLLLLGCQNERRVPIVEEFIEEDLQLIFVGDDWEMNVVTFTNQDEKEVLRIEYDTGNIYYWDRLVTTDKELVDAFRNMFEGYICPHCEKSMYEIDIEKEVVEPCEK